MKIDLSPRADVDPDWCHTHSRGEPVQQCDAGASGTPNCCLTSTNTRLSREEAPPGDEKGHGTRPKGRETDVERIIERCAGLDVHKSSVTACVRISEESQGLHQEIREFATTTGGLLLLRDWLASFEVRLVGMEATGVYWKPIYYMLEDDFELWLLNARHLKNVPGRKTDVKDAEWICQLVEHGRVRPSFVPPKEMRELRNLTRYRKA